MVLMQIAGFKERPGLLTITRRGEDDFLLSQGPSILVTFMIILYTGDEWAINLR